MTQLDDLVDAALANPLAVLGAAAIGLIAIGPSVPASTLSILRL